MSLCRKFIEQSSAGLLSLLTFPLSGFANIEQGFKVLVVNEDEGESYLLRNGTTMLKIKIAKMQGAQNICFLSENILPAEGISVHKHSYEDEMIFIHSGSGIFTMGEKEYAVKEGTIAIVPKGIWHSLRNNGIENIEMRFAYTASGFKGFFREVGTPVGHPFVKKPGNNEKQLLKNGV